MKIKTGDKVKILSGKDRGKTGKVIQVLIDKKTNRKYAVVEGANILKKHIRSRQRGQQGQIIELSAPVDISNVMLIDSKTNKPTRVGFAIEANDKKRVAKKSGEFVD